MKYPIGVQSFEDLRTSGYVYVDKTDLVYKLTEECKYVFLGRPRRFGKSLLLSTIQAYFEGRKDLFEGLAIESLATDWTVHPVLHFDLNIGNYSSVGGLMNLFNDQLMQYESIYGKNPENTEPQFRFRWLVQRAHELTGHKVVVLIDEYDKPVLNSIGNDELDTAFRNILKPFYGTLKTEDEHIRFAMLTGVSKFGKLSVFSDLNNIKDISMLPRFASICGITKKEILDNFAESIANFADSLDISTEEMIERLRLKYDGYRFTKTKKLVFNPFSLLNAFADCELRDYWFESGTPTFLANLLKQKNYDLASIDGTQVGEESLYQVDNISAIPILYQSGYLTIKDYNERSEIYTLGYPNREVEKGFMNFILPFYATKIAPIKAKIEIFKLIDEIEAGDVEAFMTRLRSEFISIPYSQDNSMKVQEDQVRNIVYLTFKLLGIEVQAECHMINGRSDAVVKTHGHIYVFEFKVDSTADAAIEQIIEKRYAEPYRCDGRSITLIGVNYSTAKREITEWKTVPVAP